MAFSAGTGLHRACLRRVGLRSAHRSGAPAGDVLDAGRGAGEVGAVNVFRFAWRGAAVAVLAVTLAGCTIGWATIAAGQHATFLGCPHGVDLGPGHISAAPAGGETSIWWSMPPGAETLRVQVLNASTSETLFVSVYWPLGGFSEFGAVWDGTRSTGPQDFTYTPPIYPFPIGIAVHDSWFGDPFESSVDFSWTFTALDEDGNETGFADCWLTLPHG
jgi:hypothetical protein